MPEMMSMDTAINITLIWKCREYENNNNASIWVPIIQSVVYELQATKVGIQYLYILYL